VNLRIRDRVALVAARRAANRALHEVLETFGGVDILIANGGGPQPAPYTALTLEE